MAWTTPITFVASQMVTAAHLNAMRDNFLETAPAKATTAGAIFVATGANAIAQRLILDDIVDASETTASTSYTSLGTNGPQITLTTGTKALVWINAHMSNSTTETTFSSFEITGASTVAAGDTRAVYLESAGASRSARLGTSALLSTSAGSNTFRMLYRVTAGTGTFLRRRMIVMAL
jgi:hypothetical protein